MASSVSYVVLDFFDQFKTFFEQLNDCKEHDYEWCIDELMTEIIRYIEDKNTINAGLAALAQDIVHYQGFFGSDTNVLVPAISELAKAMYWEFDSYGLYDRDGFLQYSLSKTTNDYKSPIMGLRSLVNEGN